MGLAIYNKYKLLEQSKDKFVNNEHRKLLRSKIALSESVVESENKAFGISGIYFELDKEGTKALSVPVKKQKDSTDKINEEREALKAEATELGLDFPSNIPNGKLIELIQNAKNAE